MRIWVLEDEYFILDGIRMLLEAEFPGNDVSLFNSARTALVKMDTELPDIVISDIVMGAYSGLDFVQELRKRNCKAPVIIISGHEEFAYAKRAIQLDVMDYLLKPVNQEKLTELLEKAMTAINGERSSNEEEDVEALKNILSFRYSLPSGTELSLSPKLSSIAGDFQAVSIRAEGIDTESLQKEAGKIFSLLCCRNVTVRQDPDRIIMVTDLDGSLLKPALTSIAVSIMLKGETRVFGGISTRMHGADQIYQAHLEAVSGETEITRQTMPASEIRENISRCFYETVAKGDFKEIPRLLSPLAESILPNTPAEVVSMAEHYYSATYEFVRPFIGDRLKSAASIGGLPYEEKSRQFLILFNALYNAQPLSGYSKKCIICDVACDIVDKNIKDASLVFVADIMKMNPTYISRIYKEVNQTNFKQYIAMTRKAYAIKLLNETDMTQADVARQVGYTDIKYFMKILKDGL